MEPYPTSPAGMVSVADSSPSSQINTRLLRATITRQAFPEADSRSLEEIFGLTSNIDCDIIFVAIDFEFIPNIQIDVSQNLDSQVGLAIPHMRKVNVDSFPSSQPILTYNFASGSSKCQERAQKKFLFGKSVAITQNDMLKSIECLIPHDCQVILVGHDIENELRALRILGFDFSGFNLTTVDTHKISRKVFPHESATLRCLLLSLGCPFAKLHCAGNDANFTLKALLLLAVINHSEQPEFQRRRAIMEEIALDPLPRIPHGIQLDFHKPKIVGLFHTCRNVKGAKRRAKRLQGSRKYQAKFWDGEMQEKIRVERADKRLAAGLSIMAIYSNYSNILKVLKIE